MTAPPPAAQPDRASPDCIAPDWISRAEALSPQVRNLVDGVWQPPSSARATIDKRAPRDGRLLCRFGAGDAGDVDRAVAAARAAFADGRWSRLPVQRRIEVLHRLAALVDAHREELALLECLDVGKPIRDALAIDLPFTAAGIRAAADSAGRLAGKVFGVDHASLCYQLRRPLGVAAAITGWNFPLALAAGKIGPALVTGNSLVLKPSEVTPLATARLAELALEAGVPEGVFNVVHGDGAIGAALAGHGDVDVVSFTGSTLTGKAVMATAAQSNMKRVVLECGGKAANIVFDDCPDLDAVADAVAGRAFWNQGQVCTASSRLLVHHAVADALVERVAARAAALVPGDPLLPGTAFGALASHAHRDKVAAYVRRGEAEGARIVHHHAGFAPPFAAGCYFAPVLFDGVAPDHAIAREEIFGPVLSILRFADEAAAIRMANGTIYGLSAIAWTRDLARAHRLAHDLNVGWTTIQATATATGGPADGATSSGGLKQSGIGVEGGIEGLEEYLARTTVQVFV